MAEGSMKLLYAMILRLILAAFFLLSVFYGIHALHEGMGGEVYYTSVEFEGVDIVLAADGEHILLRTAKETFPITNCGWHYLRYCRLDDVCADDYLPSNILDYRHYVIDPRESCFEIRIDNNPSAKRVGCYPIYHYPDRVVR